VTSEDFQWDGASRSLSATADRFVWKLWSIIQELFLSLSLSLFAQNKLLTFNRLQIVKLDLKLDLILRFASVSIVILILLTSILAKDCNLVAIGLRTRKSDFGLGQTIWRIPRRDWQPDLTFSKACVRCDRRCSVAVITDNRSTSNTLTSQMRWSVALSAVALWVTGPKCRQTSALKFLLSTWRYAERLAWR